MSLKFRKLLKARVIKRMEFSPKQHHSQRIFQSEHVLDTELVSQQLLQSNRMTTVFLQDIGGGSRVWELITTGRILV